MLADRPINTDYSAYDHEAWAVLRQGIALLRGPKVLGEPALEELMINAPVRGARDASLFGKPPFRLERDLPKIINSHGGIDGINDAEAKRLNDLFSDYQWSRTPNVWNAYFAVRRTCSSVCNQSMNLSDPDAVVAPLFASLSRLVQQREVAKCARVNALRPFLENLTHLNLRCEKIPKSLNLFDTVVAALLPTSAAGRRTTERCTAMNQMCRELRELCHTLRPALIAFGAEYRTQYIDNNQGERSRSA